MNTLTQEKANVARLRDLYEKEANPLIKESIQFRLAEARLWHDVAECEVLTPERIEQARRKKCRTGAIVCFVIAGIAAAILAVSLFGCNLAREGLYGTGRCIGALGEDVRWSTEQLADNIQTEK